nr:class I SAM-dependent methyltransferase [uncultured Pseudodesulfovibrio sp.]
MITFKDTTIGALEFTVRWEHNNIQHEEWFLGRKFNPVNDVFPRGMRESLEGKGVGDSVTITYEPRMCIPRHKESMVQTFDLDRLRPKTIQGESIVPREGRFYPQGHINGLLDVYPDTLTPFRLTQIDDETFTADRNHPLSTIPVTITATIQYMEERGTGTYGSLTHWREKICDWGPGMQATHDDEPTDFFHPAFFDRKATEDTPFSPPPVDVTAKQNLENAYARFIKPDMRVLDFSMGTERPQGKFDAAICTFSVEYMHRPVDIIRYVSHFLEPGAPIVIGFSNTFDESNVIQGWKEMHEFERMGLVLEYLRFTKLDNEAGTLSFRNDWRQKDDPLFRETKGVSDPIYVVYGHKAK